MVHRSMYGKYILKILLKTKTTEKIHRPQYFTDFTGSCYFVFWVCKTNTFNSLSSFFPTFSFNLICRIVHRYKALNFAPLSHHFTSYRSAASQSVSDVQSISIYLQPGSTLTAWHFTKSVLNPDCTTKCHHFLIFLPRPSRVKMCRNYKAAIL